MAAVAKGGLRALDERFPALLSRLNISEQRRRRETLQHPAGLRRPSLNAVVIPDRDPDDDDIAIASRLLAAHRAAPERSPAPADADIWSDLAQRQQRFASILDREDAEELARYLCNVSRHDAAVGITQGEAEFDRITRDACHRDHVALMAKDKLVSLAEAVGAIAVENPEQGAYGESLQRDAGELVHRISERIGLDIVPPEIDGGLLKLDTGRGHFGERDANAIYTAWLLAQVASEQEDRRVCEIGGGSGRVAYWSHRLGLTAYTIVDLPQTNLVQGYYLLKSLPPDSVVLHGEGEPGRAQDRLQILPTHAIADVADSAFGVVLNQDSFPEINRDAVVEYLHWIRRTCTGSLVSINHESKPPGPDGVTQLSVPEVVHEVGGFTLAQRWPYWLRKGYVVERYRVGA